MEEEIIKDAKGRTIYTKSSVGVERHYAYDEKGRCVYSKSSTRTTWRTYTDRGLETFTIYKDGREVLIKYNLAGNPICSCHEDGTEYHYCYDLDNKLRLERVIN